MSKFNIGDKVINTSSDERGIIIAVHPPRRGMQLYRVKYSDRENDEKSAILNPDVDLTDPFERWRHRIYGHYTEYLKGNTAFKILSTNNSTISSLKASKTLFRPYQFKPLLKFINSDNRRLLIADEVGLGKTIEAGHIMLELKARNEFRNALVICPMSLRTKWATELQEKFGLDFFEIDNKSQILQELRNHNGTVRAVINYDKIREESDIIKYIDEKNIKFSIIVCDESHRLRNNTTHIYHGATKLLAHADSVVFMSATPIMINEENLYNQLHLLDPDVFNNQEVFENNLQLNKPFVNALISLNDGLPLHSISETLSMSEVTTYVNIGDIVTTNRNNIDEYFSEYPIYKKIMEDLASKDDTPSLRARLQHNMSEMSPMNSIFSRTRKREVTQDWTQAERNPHKINVSLYPDEKLEYETIIDEYIDDHTTFDEYGRLQTGTLGLVTVKRQLASSVWAYQCKSIENDYELDIACQNNDAKFDALLRILNEVFAHGNKKIIVFAIFKKTLLYLSYRLKKEGYNSVVIYGGSNIDKTEALQQFQYDRSIQILLSSEVGSEGLDMQFCNSLVNYDLPWNPMVVEQRIGRIDRFGQESPKVNIYNIVVNDSILEKIYSRLLERIGIFRNSIGDLEAILNSEMKQDGKTVTIKEALSSVERDFYSDKLSEDEIERKRAEIERAIENEKLNLKNIEEGLTNSLTNDSYFRDEINKIVNNNSYVTSNELYQFVIQMIKEELTTCELRQSNEPEIYEFIIPKSSPNTLRRFLQRYIPADRDGLQLFQRYIDKIEGELVLRITFNQETAFKDKSLSYINLYHPIVRAGVKMFAEKQDPSQCTYFFAMPAAALPASIKQHKYILAIYRITVSRVLFDKPVVTDSLYPILYDLEEKKIITDQDIAEKFMGQAQVKGRYQSLEDGCSLNPDIIDDIRYDFNDYVDEYKREYKHDLQIRIDNNKQMRAEQTKLYYDSREINLKNNISNQEWLREEAIRTGNETAIKNAEGALRLMNHNLVSLQQERDNEIERINKDVQLKVTERVMSINLVQVV